MTYHQDLVNKYYEAKESYYQGDPIMTDLEFDQLEDELISLGFDMTVGFDDVDDSDKVQHRNKMLSLRKKQVLTETGHITIEMANEVFDKYGPGILSYKYDGMAGEAQYVNGKLTSIVSRGDGDKGRNLYPKLHDLLPQELDQQIDVDIRFEICMQQSVFDTKYSKEIGGKYSHARNLVAGIVRDENNDDPRKYDLKFITIEAIDINSNLIDVVGLHTFYVENYKSYFECHNSENLIRDFNIALRLRFDYDYPTDGMVYTSINAKTFEHDGKYPDYATSIKFAPPITISTITNITWKLHKTGRYVPMIHFKPVVIDGRKISKASGHNIEYLAKNGITIPEQGEEGKKVKIILSNDIIPMVKSL